MRYQEFAIIEARRNPELNPKISIYKALEPYKDRDDVYVSFVADVGKDFSKKSFRDKDTRKRGKGIPSLDRNISGFKAGINPKSTFNTPNGLYVYPLKQAWKMYASEARQMLEVPFGGERPEVMVVQAKPGAKIVDLEKYNSNDFDRDYGKLADIIVKQHMRKKFSEAAAWEMAKSTLRAAMLDSRDKTPGGQFWNMTRYTFFVLYGGLIFTNIMPEYRDEVLEMFKDINSKANYGDSTVRLDAFLKTSTPNTERSNKWSKIFMDLGYSAIMDKAGKGIIHQAEPMQGVFIDPTSYKIIDSSANKSYQKQDAASTYGKDWIFNADNPHETMKGTKGYISSVDFLEGVVTAYSSVSGKLKDETDQYKMMTVIGMVCVKAMKTLWGTSTAKITSMNDDLFEYIYKNIKKEPNVNPKMFYLTLKSPSEEPMIEIHGYNGLTFWPSKESGEYDYLMSWDDLMSQKKIEKLEDWINSQAKQGI